MGLDPQADRALYRQLADVLRDRIISGELRPGGKLPSETTLSQEYGLARPLVRQAIQILRGEGLIVTLPGKGTIVRPEVEREQVRLSPGDSAICRQALESERKRLGLTEGVPVLVVSRASGPTEYHAGDRVVLVA